MVLIRGPSVFEMGSGPSEPRRASDEVLHPESVPPTFAISNKPVTTAEFQAYLLESGLNSEW
jgi:formylglycine-generating enzyme required for sulfatase activity